MTTKREPRWEIHRTAEFLREHPGEYFGHFRAGNGKVLSSTETYTEKRHVLRAIGDVVGDRNFHESGGTFWLYWNGSETGVIEVRDLSAVEPPKRTGLVVQ